MNDIDVKTEEMILDMMKRYKLSYNEIVRKGLVAYKYLRENIIDKDRELYVIKEDGLMHKISIRGK